MTTRRRHLALTGARRFHLEPFAVEETLALFARMLGEEMVGEEKAALAEMGDLPGHLPLAIDVVASRLAHEPGWSVADFLAQLRLENGRLNRLAYEEHSVGTALESSYALLAPEQQHLFTTLGTFGGEDFSVEAAAAVAGVPGGEAEANLRQLFGLSLVRRGRPGRYRLTPVLQSFAREKIGRDDVWERMVNFFVAYTERYERDEAMLDLEKSNILAALEVARERGTPGVLKQGVKAFSYFLKRRGLYKLDIVRYAQEI